MEDYSRRIVEMTLKQVAALGRELWVFLGLFADCFGRREARTLLRVYVQGQLSDLHRKTAEAIALRFGAAPRTLQLFLESIKWDEEKLRDRCQRIVARDHAHPEAVGIVDESGTTKSGVETVGVGRQYNGHRGKLDNCVVGVHLSYAAPGFQTLLDSAVYLPEDYANDPARRKKLRARRGGVSHQTADRRGTDRPGFGQRRTRGGLDVRRTVRSRRQVSGRFGRAPGDPAQKTRAVQGAPSTIRVWRVAARRAKSATCCATLPCFAGGRGNGIASRTRRKARWSGKSSGPCFGAKAKTACRAAGMA